MTDDFSSFATADTYDDDFSMQINRVDHVATSPSRTINIPLKATSIIGNLGKLSDTTKSSLGYNIGEDGHVHYFTLPYTTANVTSQKFASRTVNVNPFSYSTKDGILSISPNVDNWVDINYAPKQLVLDPTLLLFTQNSAAHLLYTEFKAISGKLKERLPKQGYDEIDTYFKQLQTSYSGYYGSSLALTNNYVTDVSILPYMRAQEIVVRASQMLHNTDIDAYFDGTNVNNYIRQSSVIELTGVTSTDTKNTSFNENDIIGYYSGGKFYVTGRVVGVFRYNDKTKLRLYVAADGTSSKYTSTSGDVGGTLYNAFFPVDGNDSNTTSKTNGTVASVIHYGGTVKNYDATGKYIKLAGTSPTSNSYYGSNSNTFYVVSGTGAGQSALIRNYYGANQTLELVTSVTTSNGDVYSIGSFETNENGSFYGIFNLPANTFHNGQRVLRLDNSNGNQGAETTYAQSTYYAEGLQTTQLQQTIASSPAAVTDIWVSGSQVKKVITNREYIPWDPVAQTFMVSKNNYPNGLFLDSISLFFKSKPLTDTASITLCILETLNGTPTQKVVNNSVVKLDPVDVKYSDTPQYLDETTKTVFKFNSPVYIQPETLYAFMLKSSSDEYLLHSVASGDTALESSTKNTPSGTANKTKISGAPYVGNLFISQNSQTWNSDPNQSLMFVIDGCVFSPSASITFAVPNKLPHRTLIEQSVQHYLDSSNVVSTSIAVSQNDILVDAFNVTATDITPTSTSLTYSYRATLQNGNMTNSTSIIPGKYGTAAQNEIYLDDGLGERVLVANSNS